MEFLFALWLICAGFSAYIADQKNRNGVAWFFLGLIFGVFALFAIGVVPKKDFKPDTSSGFGGGWKCSACGTKNSYSATKCKKCGLLH